MMKETTANGSRRHAAPALVVMAACACAWMPAAMAQSDAVDSVLDEQARAVAEARDSQQRIAQLDDEATRMLAEYRQILIEVHNLDTYNRQLSAQVESQEEELSGMERQLVEIETTASEVMPMMERMLDTLEQFVGLDLPFLPDERRDRIANLRDIMRRADVTVSEKYRRIVEAYGVEMEYGRTIESYRDVIDGGAEPRTVDFLRLGRIALLYQTLDGRETGYWDMAAAAWVVDDSYQRAVRNGLRIAKQQAAPDLIIAPVPAPKEVGL